MGDPIVFEVNGMFYIWWPGFCAAAVLVICGLIRFPKYKKHPEWPQERCAFAEKTFHRLVWQEGVLFGALSFMLMRSTRLMSVTGQYILLGAMLVVMAGAILLMEVPVCHAVEEKFGEDNP